MTVFFSVPEHSPESKMRSGTVCIVFIQLIVMLSFAYGSEPTGSISDEVVSQRTQDPIIGPFVMLDGTSLGAITDTSGTFAIASINHFPRQGTSPPLSETGFPQ